LIIAKASGGGIPKEKATNNIIKTIKQDTNIQPNRGFEINKDDTQVVDDQDIEEITQKIDETQDTVSKNIDDIQDDTAKQDINDVINYIEISNRYR